MESKQAMEPDQSDRVLFKPAEILPELKRRIDALFTTGVSRPPVSRQEASAFCERLQALGKAMLDEAFPPEEGSEASAPNPSKRLRRDFVVCNGGGDERRRSVEELEPKFGVDAITGAAAQPPIPPPPPPPPAAGAACCSGGASGVELHYDAQACRHSSLGQALATRRSGVLYTYKRYANAVKRQLICEHATSARCLVDIGCGRGGDIAKWRDAGVRRVVATDLSAAQLDEARGREHDGQGRGGQGRGKATGGGTQIVWRQQSMLDPELAARLAPELEWANASAGADAVAAMFCIQFSFGSEGTASALLRQVSLLLRPGGVFFGTAPDADAVLDALGGREAVTLAPPVFPFVLRLRRLGGQGQDTGGGGRGGGGGAAEPAAGADRALPSPAGEFGHGLFFSLEDTVTQVRHPRLLVFFLELRLPVLFL
jgi:SAM-dependent methyltransferase